MIPQLPNFVFRQTYDYYFLFTEFDIIFNEDFYKSLIKFFHRLGNNKLFFEIEIFEHNNVTKKSLEYLNPNVITLQNFYKTEVQVENRPVLTQYLNHFIYSDIKNWEIYVSPEFEMSLFACDEAIVDKLWETFKIYEDEGFEAKVKIIGDRYSDEQEKNFFFEKLNQNYIFQRKRN